MTTPKKTRRDTTLALTRREFVRRGGALGAAALALPWIVPARARGSDGHTSPSERIGVGIIGCGRRGREHAAALQSLFPDAQLRAVCDVDAARAAALAGGHADAIRDFRELLARPDIDAVIVATPDHWHAIPALMAARAGKDIYCETPLCLTVEEGIAIRDTVRRFGRVFQSGETWRSAPVAARAREVLREGLLGGSPRFEIGLPRGGEVMSFAAGQKPPDELDYNLWLGPAPWAPYARERIEGFHWFFDTGGGTLTQSGAQLFDIYRFLNGDPAMPRAIGGSADFPGDSVSDTPLELNLELETAAGALVACSTALPVGVRIAGDRHWLHIDPAGQATSDSEELRAAIRIDPGAVREGDPLQFASHFALHLRDFLDCVRHRRLTRAPAETSHHAATIAHLANIALRTGRRIEWDTEKETVLNDTEARAMLGRPPRAPWHL